MKKSQFSTISYFISEMIQDTAIVKGQSTANFYRATLFIARTMPSQNVHPSYVGILSKQ